MVIKRTMEYSYSAPIEAGFLGEGHRARSVLQVPYAKSDPFIALMDDMLQKETSSPAGGPHPHAGFETVSLMLDGEIGDMIESLKKGDFQIMTAGRGVVHTETINQPTNGRLLQMWLNLPSKERWVTPRVQNLPAAHVPVYNSNDINIRLYSGTLGALSSPVLNYVPLIAAEFTLQPCVETRQVIPADFNSFIYMIRGEVYIGEEEKILKQDETGWLNLPAIAGNSELLFKAGNAGGRFVLYAGKPQGEKFVSQGPFIGDTGEDIKKVYSLYVQKKLQHIADAPGEQRLDW